MKLILNTNVWLVISLPLIMGLWVLTGDNWNVVILRCIYRHCYTMKMWWTFVLFTHNPLHLLRSPTPCKLLFSGFQQESIMVCQIWDRFWHHLGPPSFLLGVPKTMVLASCLVWISYHSMSNSRPIQLASHEESPFLLIRFISARW